MMRRVALALALAGCAVQPIVLRQAQDDNARSWVLAEAKGEPLLYVSDGKFGSVYMFSYPAGKLVGDIKGLALPEGVCADRAGNVYIVTQSNSTISEYAHGATKPIATLSDPDGSPLGCTVDPATGNLAVSNQFGPISGSGWPPNVLIYRNARGTPKVYSNDSMLYLYFCGYDAAGDLFVDGQLLSDGSDGLAELPKGNSDFASVALDPKVSVGGGVQWEGKYLAAGDDSGSSGHATVYRVAVHGGKGRIVGATPLEGDNDILSFWIGGGTLVGGDLTAGTVMYWHYPRGGTATKSLSGFSDPVAMTVSAPPK